jgi:hypothetical protein
MLKEKPKMPLTDPDEISRRAVIRSVDPLTELVTVVDADPGNNDPDPDKVIVDPDDLFELTFSRVGIDSDLLIGGFVTGLKHQVPGFSAEIQQAFSNLKPGVQIGLVRKRLTSVIALAMAKAKSDGRN